MNRESKLMDMFCYTLVFVLIALQFCSSADAADFDGTKQKRSDRGSVGLFPFPRVGRSDPEAVPESDPSYSYMSIDDYDLGRNEYKRQGLVPFPRVGRSQTNVRGYLRGPKQSPDSNIRTLNSNAAASAMWYGPRLGKRSLEDNGIFTPRLGKKSGDLTTSFEKNNFTPRLGKRNTRDFMNEQIFLDNSPLMKLKLQPEQFTCSCPSI